MPPSILDYHSDTPTFSLAFSPLSTSSPSSLRLAVGSYSEQRLSSTAANPANGLQNQPNYINNFTIAQPSPSYPFDELEDASEDEHDETAVRSVRDGRRVHPGPAFQAIARAPLLYPPSSVQFAPARLSASLASGAAGGAAGQGQGETREIVASSSECLRLWDLIGEAEDGSGAARGGGFVGQQQGGGTRTRLVSRATLQNSKADYSAPLTSFSWSQLEPTHIVTSSIDTTCTVWDISTGVPVTQLIAHDKEVYDVAWSPQQREVFTSVGADGSVRMFDLRSLEHSTILYEAAAAAAASRKNGSSASPSSSSSTPPPALLRVAFSPTSPSYLSVVHADSPEVQILDVRAPGAPAFVVQGHKAAVNGMSWGGETMQVGGGETSGPGWLATVSDDATLLLWDLSNATPPAPTTRSAPHQPKPISTPALAYTAPSEVNAVAWGGGGDWVAVGCGRTVRTLRV